MAGRDHDKSRSERGMILRLLVVDQAAYTLVKSLCSMLDRRGFSLSRRALLFHIEYLEKAKYVEIRRVKNFPSLLNDDDSLSPDEPWDLTWTDRGLQLMSRDFTDDEVTV